MKNEYYNIYQHTHSFETITKYRGYKSHKEAVEKCKQLNEGLKLKYDYDPSLYYFVCKITKEYL